MKLIVITPSRDVPDETALVTKMFESGLGTLHLRKPRYSTRQMADYIRQIPAHFHNRIVIHSHHKLALRYNLRGIHLTRSHLSGRWKYFILRARLKFRFQRTQKSRSYTRLQQVYQPEEHTFDYCFLGTMFNNMTGELYSGYYEDAVRAANSKSGKKLVARGGTTPQVIEKSVRYGFSGIAFNSYIWKADRPFANFLQVLEEFKKHQIVPE